VTITWPSIHASLSGAAFEACSAAALAAEAPLQSPQRRPGLLERIRDPAEKCCIEAGAGRGAWASRPAAFEGPLRERRISAGSAQAESSAGIRMA